MYQDGLRLFIKQRGSQTAAAKDLGVSKTRLNNWINLPTGRMPILYAERIQELTEGKIGVLALTNYLNFEDREAVIRQSKRSCQLQWIPPHTLICLNQVKLNANQKAYAEYCLEHEIKQSIIIDPGYQVRSGYGLLFMMQYRKETTVPVRMIDTQELLEGKYQPYDLAHLLSISLRAELGHTLELYTGCRKGQRSDLQARQKFDEVKEVKNPSNFFQPRQNFDEVTPDIAQNLILQGRTDELLAQRLGFGNRQTYYQAKFIYLHGSLELIAAVDTGQIKIFRAYQLIKAQQSQSFNN